MRLCVVFRRATGRLKVGLALGEIGTSLLNERHNGTGENLDTGTTAQANATLSWLLVRGYLRLGNGVQTNGGEGRWCTLCFDHVASDPLLKYREVAIVNHP